MQAGSDECKLVECRVVLAVGLISRADGLARGVMGARYDVHPVGISTPMQYWGAHGLHVHVAVFQ